MSADESPLEAGGLRWVSGRGRWWPELQVREAEVWRVVPTVEAWRLELARAEALRLRPLSYIRPLLDPLCPVPGKHLPSWAYDYTRVDRRWPWSRQVRSWDGLTLRACDLAEAVRLADLLGLPLPPGPPEAG